MTYRLLLYPWDAIQQLKVMLDNGLSVEEWTHDPAPAEVLGEGTLEEMQELKLVHLRMMEIP